MRRTYLLAVCLTMAGALAPAIGAHADAQNGGVRVRLLEAPESRRNDPRAHSYVIDHVRPGTTISRRIGVTNESTGPLGVRLYVGGADIGTGTFQALDAPNELSGWTAFAPNHVELLPGREETTVLTIRVPAAATSGERYGVAWAELPGSTDQGVTSVNRVGIRIYLSVGPGGEPASDFVIDTMTAKRNRDGTPVVSAQVTNTGARALDLSGSLRLTAGPGGLSAGPFVAKLGTTLAIGDSEPVEIPLDKQIPDGPWEAALELRSGTTQRSAVAHILFPKPGESGPAVEVKARSNRSVVGVAALGFGVILFVLVLLFLLIFRRRRKDEDEDGLELARPSRR